MIPHMDPEEAFFRAMEIWGQHGCRYCGSHDTEISGSRFMWSCYACRRQFSCWREGSPLYHSRLQAVTLFGALYLVDHGQPDKILAQELGVNHHTARRLRLILAAREAAEMPDARRAMYQIIEVSNGRAA